MEIKPLNIETGIENNIQVITGVNGQKLDEPLLPIPRKNLIVKKYDYKMLRISEWTKERIEDDEYPVPNDFCIGNYVYNVLTGEPSYLRCLLPDNLLLNVVKPVKLDDNILFSLGFKKRSDGTYLFKDSDFILKLSDKYGYSDEYGIPISNLHNLQNHFRFVSSMSRINKYGKDYFLIRLYELPELHES